MFPEPKSVSGKRLVPSLAVGCLVFAIVGVLGTFAVGTALQPYFAKKNSEAQWAKQAERREAGQR